MHTQTQFDASSFDIEFETGGGGLDRLYPNWVPLDRFGIIIDCPLGGVGASHLIQLAMYQYYSTPPERRSMDIYPEIYAFHAGRDYGSFLHFDFWPPRREVIVAEEPEVMLAALNDRGITRLAIPEGFAITTRARPKETASFGDLVTSAYEYSPSGRVANGDVRVTGLDRRTEINATKTLSALNPPPATAARPVRAQRRPFKESDPEFAVYEARRATALTQADVDRAKADRDRIRVGDGAAESYRTLSTDEVIGRMGAAD
jgi:hypothetical protein